MSVTSESPKTPTSRLAQFIKELRGDASQREFAKVLGISYTTIQDWEKQIRLPSPKNLQRLSQLKGWTQAELLNYLFAFDQANVQKADPVEHIVSNLHNLSPKQIEAINQYLELRINSHKNLAEDIQS